MDEKELKKLSRLDLLKILLEQRKEIDRLEALVADREAQLADRAIKVDQAGTLAEASFALNGVLEAAQAAADQYLENLKTMNDTCEAKYNQKMEEAETRSAVMIMAASERVDAMKEDAQAYCTELKQRTTSECNAKQDHADAMVQTATVKAANIVEEAETKSAMMLNDAQLKVDKALSSITEQAEAKIKDADDYYNAKMAKVEADVEKKWDSLTTRLEAFYQAHAGLRELLAADTIVKRE